MDFILLENLDDNKQWKSKLKNKIGPEVHSWMSVRVLSNSATICPQGQLTFCHSKSLLFFKIDTDFSKLFLSKTNHTKLLAQRDTD